MKKRIFKSMSLLAILSIILTSLVLSVFSAAEMYDAETAAAQRGHLFGRGH